MRNTPLQRNRRRAWRHGQRDALSSSPCSGHGFKFSSAIGEIQADLLTKGETEFDLSPFRIDRWAPS